MKKGLVVILSAILVTSTIVVMPVIASDWPEFQKDAVNIGSTGDRAPITAPNETVSWVHQTAAGPWYGIDTVPIVVGDYVYVLAANPNHAYLYKYYKNGTATGGNWPVEVGGGNLQNSCPAYGDGKIFVLNTGYQTIPRLYGINANTGSIDINEGVGTSDFQLSCPITCYDDGTVKRLFFGSVRMSNEDPVNLSDDGIYYCYYANNGTQAWSRNTNTGGGYYWAGAAVVGNYLVYGDDKSNVTSVYLVNGTNVSEVNVSAEYGVDAKEIRSSIAYNASTGRIYFSSKGGYCFALGINADGTFNTSDKWSHSIGYSTSTPAVYNGKVYVGHSAGFSQGKLYCLNENNGNEVWNAPVGPVQSSPVISTWYDNDIYKQIYIYVTTNSDTGGLYCIDKDGNEVWHNTSVGSNKYALAGAAISDGWVFYGNDGGYLHALWSGLGTPDLKITKAVVNWTENVGSDCTICYEITNVGNGIAPPGHNTSLFVNGNETELDFVDVAITPGLSTTRCFSHTYTPVSEIGIYADRNNTVSESDENNWYVDWLSGTTNTSWMCGDVDNSGRIKTSDARKVGKRTHDKNYPLHEWAADVDKNNKIKTSDARKVHKRVHNSGYPLNCWCD